MTFELEGFIAECRAALNDPNPHAAVRDVVARVVSDPQGVVAALGAPERAELVPLFQSSELTVMRFVWGPGMRIRPHDHRMWAVIGVYGGREDNVFYRKSEKGIDPGNARTIETGEAVPLGRDIIHAVHNPTNGLTPALHVYGGDFFAQARSEWDPITLKEQPFDMARTRRLFEESNEAMPGRR